jgi:hypothetical protein
MATGDRRKVVLLIHETQQQTAHHPGYDRGEEEHACHNRALPIAIHLRALAIDLRGSDTSRKTPSGNTHRTLPIGALREASTECRLFDPDLLHRTNVRPRSSSTDRPRSA